MKTRILLFVFSLTALPLLAGSRTSANYTITADVLDAGAQPTTGVNIANVGSIGGIAGLSQNVSPLELARQGYIGQLYEATALLLNASLTNVPAGSNTQLGAVARLDDNTFLSLAATQVIWSVTTGPIANIDANGLATAGVVSQNTAAIVRGDSLGATGTLQLVVIAGSGESSPRIVNFHLEGAKAIFSGTNGPANQSFYVLTSTNVALALSNWAAIGTNSFDASGNFSFTNTINLAEPKRFFRLKVP